jgi:DNA-binding CsgD family transcriptional regulator
VDWPPRAATSTRRARHEESARLFAALGDDAGAAIATLHLGRLALDEGDLATAGAKLAEGLRLAEHAGDAAAMAAGLDGVAGLAGALGRMEAAARLAGAAAALGATAGAAGRSARGDAASPVTRAARAALGETGFAVAWAAGRAMPPEQAVEYALALARPGGPSAGPAPPQDAGPADPLTPREREVARLITEGRTNREIAEALVISEWTVDTHVRHILTKLELRSRTQVAAWAVEHGLVAP